MLSRKLKISLNNSFLRLGARGVGKSTLLKSMFANIPIQFILYFLIQRGNFGSLRLNRPTSRRNLIVNPLSTSAKNFMTRNALYGLVTRSRNCLEQYPRYIGKTGFERSLEFSRDVGEIQIAFISAHKSVATFMTKVTPK